MGSICMLFENLLYGRFAYSILCMYLFNHLFISIWTHEHLFHSSGYNPMLFNFLFRLSQLWSLGAPPGGSSVLLTCPIIAVFLSTSFSCGARCSILYKSVLYIYSPHPRISHCSKEPLVPFTGTEIWALSVLPLWLH
ncbi:hypothetical protein HJG60_007832 [Phyllostomus discolor]|uniref:Uncharacterized protein n=1 Tax=Phyllostomus discolor TaxID=89673 RepID=A0A834BKZ2_9CHIR|nr:hypothetical protein HJG60_007832 [Phyllostomus discolor]